jgi:hypothetical protein
MRARIFQHENDHLEGVCYPEKIKNMKRDFFHINNIQDFITPCGELKGEIKNRYLEYK